MEVYLNGIERYREWNGYPREARTEDGIANNRIMATEMAQNTEWYQDFVAEIPNKSIIRIDSETISIADPFGNELKFFHNKGIGGSPLLISAGPDGQFDTEDDIRSDDRVH